MLSERTPTWPVRRPHDYPQPPRRGASPCHIVRFVHGQGVAIRRTIALAAGTAVLLAACSDPEPSPLPTATDAAPTETASAGAPTPTPTAAAIDITTTPDVVTPEWVDAVVNHLLTKYGELGAEILAEPTGDDASVITPYADRLKALFAGQYLQRQGVALAEIGTDADDIRIQLLPSADFIGLRFNTDFVQFAEPGCVIAIGRISRAGTIPGGGYLPAISAVSLTRTPEPDAGINPSGWVITDELYNVDADGAPLPDEILTGSALEAYTSLLDNDCTGGTR
jgi:hypothetical protein